MEGKPKPIEIQDEYFQTLKDRTESLYKKTPIIFCPYLKGSVHFNARGLNHIFFKKRNASRSRFEQYLRLRLFHLVPKILKRSHTVQGILGTPTCTYYEFIAIIGEVRMKVIIKESLDKHKSFLSVIPFWRMDKEQDRRILADKDIDAEVDLNDDPIDRSK